jgi:hypothetical protein
VITVNGYRRNDQNKEEKMNARKVVSIVCILVVGLALEITALAGPPGVEYRPGVNLIYRGYGYNVAPKQNVPVYQGKGYQLPSFYRGWASNRSAAPTVKQPHPGLLSNMYVVPEVRVPRY